MNRGGRGLRGSWRRARVRAELRRGHGELAADIPAAISAWHSASSPWSSDQSIYAVPEQVKGGFEVTATTPDGVVMAIEDAAAGRWAVQFHPEPILTASGRAGHRAIANVLRLSRAAGAARLPAS